MALTNPHMSEMFNYKVAYIELLKGMEDLKAKKSISISLKDEDKKDFKKMVDVEIAKAVDSHMVKIDEFKSYLEKDINSLRKLAKEKGIEIKSKATGQRILTEIFYEMF